MMIMIRKTVQIISHLLPIKKNRVLFFSYYGSQYGCNPKYISQYLVREYSENLEVIWGFTNTRKSINGVRVVKYGSLKWYVALATSKVICTNYRMTDDFVKRKKQIYIQTWHSSLRLKKIEADVEGTLPADYVKMAKKDSAQTDYVLAGCGLSHKTFEKSFWYSGTILDCGTPRNDFLVQQNSQQSQTIRHSLGIKNNEKIVMYAPTFRNNHSLEPYNIDIMGLVSALCDRFGGEWKVLLKLHPHIMDCKLFKGVQEVVDVSTYDDVQELLLVSDVLITDYSSLMFDFALTRRPVFLYASDIQCFVKNERSFYFRIQDLPFQLSKTNNELTATIRKYNANEYNTALNCFNNSIDSYENGCASKIVSDLIIDCITR